MKNDNLKRNDAQPPVISGDFVSTQSVVAVTHLAVTGPFRGDFQVIDQGRVIVGEDPDIGSRGILSAKALQGFNNNGINTFAVWFATTEAHAPGDFHAGNLAGNFLQYNQADGTLGLYTPDGAGVIMDNDGTFIAGHQDHGHMKWDAVSESLKIMSGREVMAEIGDAGSATFQGIITATGGRITGRMLVEEVLQAGDSDGPAIYLGKFERTNDQGETVESSEIIATDANNKPWFHVTAGGETAGGGFFALGGQGDYAQRLTYDGTDLVFDGTLYARGGEFTGVVEIAAGGALVWGAGTGRADLDGIHVQAYLLGDADNTRHHYNIVTADNAETLGWLGGFYGAAANSVLLRADSTGTARNATMGVAALADTGETVEASLAAQQAGSILAYIGAYVSAAGQSEIRANSAAMGFHGVAPVARQLLATGAGHTVDDVIAALQALGLVRQS